MRHKKYERIGEDLYIGELKNGLRMAVALKPGFKTSYAVFATNYGGAHRRFYLGNELHETPAGVAHYLEHKMFDMPDGDNAMSVLAANGAQPNAFTSSGMTAYYFDCTSGFEVNLRMLLSFVSTPYFTDETVQKERGIIGQEINMVEDDPGYVIYNRLMRMLYEHHPIREQVAGSIESISHITAQMLYDCHKAFYAPSNMALCVAADCDPEAVFALADDLLPHERADIPEVDLGEKESDKPIKTFNEEFMEVSAPQFIIGSKVIPAKGGDKLLRQKIIGQLALRTLYGSSSEFYNRLYSEGLLSRDFDCETDYSAGTATIMLGGESRDPERVLREVIDTAAKPLDEAAFERSRRASYGARLRALEDMSSECLSLTDGIFGGYCALDAFDVLRDIKPAECEEYIKTNLDPDKLAMSVIRPEKA